VLDVLWRIELAHCTAVGKNYTHRHWHGVQRRKRLRRRRDGGRQQVLLCVAADGQLALAGWRLALPARSLWRRAASAAACPLARRRRLEEPNDDIHSPGIARECPCGASSWMHNTRHLCRGATGGPAPFRHHDASPKKHIIDRHGALSSAHLRRGRLLWRPAALRAMRREAARQHDALAHSAGDQARPRPVAAPAPVQTRWIM